MGSGSNGNGGGKGNKYRGRCGHGNGDGNRDEKGGGEREGKQLGYLPRRDRSIEDVEEEATPTGHP